MAVYGGIQVFADIDFTMFTPPGPALAGVVQDAFLSPMISGPAQQCKMYGPKCSTKIAKTRKVLNTDAGEKQLLVK